MGRVGADKLALYDALKGFVSGADPSGGYAEVATELGITEGNLRVSLHRMRKRYRQALEEAIGDTVADVDEVPGEIDHLLRVFS